MAKKDIINFSGNKTWGVNTTFSVGPGAGNGQADVMLVQALLHYITNLSLPIIKMRSGLTNSDLSRIDGICGRKTNLSILKFQRANAQKLLRVDGKIDQAIYEGRVINSEMTDYFYHNEAEPIMTITLLHLYAYFGTPTMSSEDYINKLVTIAPTLKSWLV